MPRRVLGLPLVFVLPLAAMSVLPFVRENELLRGSFLSAAGVLAAWYIWLLGTTRRPDRALTVTVDLRAQHWVQGCAQVAVLLYWSVYWHGVTSSVHLIIAQLLFAYAFDMLLAWSRRGTYALGFGPVPVILSASLFLWFKAEWFYLQFLLVAIGFAAKELVRWSKGGRRVHIFNPSAFPLALFSVILIVTGTTDLTWGQEIATTLNNAPHIYTLIFLVSLPVQLLFGVATMTMSAVVTMYAWGLVYFGVTGTYYFVDSYIPIAVFLGMHLLFTDPSTSPRTAVGRIVFGALYALSVITVYAVLDRFGAPTFADKLLAVPVMNLAVRAIDRAAERLPKRFDAAARAEKLVGRPRHLASVGVWAVLFIALSATQAVGDTHRGQWVTFWLTACEDNRPNGCRQAARLASAYCGAGSGWACNEYGILLQPARRPARAEAAFERGCTLGFSIACDNLDPAMAQNPRRGPPTSDDYYIVLRGKGHLSDLTPLELHQRACVQGFVEGC